MLSTQDMIDSVKNNTFTNKMAADFFLMYNYSENQFQDFSEALKNNQSLSSMLIYETRRRGIRGIKVAQALADVLKYNTCLKSLAIDAINIGPAGIKAISSALVQNRSLLHLEIRWEELGVEGIKALTPGLTQNQTLQGLHLFNDSLGCKEAQELALILEKNNSITELNLGTNNIADAGIKALAMVLQFKPKLIRLSFSFNQMGDDGIQSLSIFLNNHRGIEFLNLYNNKFNNIHTAEMLAAALLNNRNLNTLKLCLDGLNCEGIEILANALLQHPTLKDLSIDVGIFNYEQKKRIEEIMTSILQHNRILRKLSVNDRPLLAEAFSHNQPEYIANEGFEILSTVGPLLTPGPISVLFSYIGYSEKSARVLMDDQPDLDYSNNNPVHSSDNNSHKRKRSTPRKQNTEEEQAISNSTESLSKRRKKDISI